ncbi:MAG: hypothetical protein IPL88_14705 [Rhizobiales bacterium]|nr:hypothetical protein [Hyphomicrobiales bacterium]
MDAFDITYNDRIYSGWDEASLLAAGVPGAVVDAERQKRRLLAAKVECRRRIYAVASAETQLNMTSVASAISLKAAAARSEDEKATAAAFVAALGWVDAMRANVAVVAADASAAIEADAAWPACPPEVAALAARF